MLSRRGNPVILRLSKKKGRDVLLRPATSTRTPKSMSSIVSSHHYLLSTLPLPLHAPLAPSPLQQRFRVRVPIQEFHIRPRVPVFPETVNRCTLKRSLPLLPPPNYSPGGRGSSLPAMDGGVRARAGMSHLSSTITTRTFFLYYTCCQ